MADDPSGPGAEVPAPVEPAAAQAQGATRVADDSRPEGGGAPRRAAERKGFVRKVLGQWPLALVLAGVALGLAIVAFTHWRLGATVVGASITVGGLLRALPGRIPGLLAVRNRPVDMILLLGVGIGIVVLAWVVPPSRG